MLLARLSNDLRSVALLAGKGHVLQSWTVGSSALESAYSIGYVGRDDKRAEKWLAHSDEAKAPWPAFDALRATLKTFGLSEFEQQFYSFYRRLCAAKHGNPLVQRRWGAAREDGATRLQLDPYYSLGAARAARWGIAWTLHGTGLGLWSFAHHQQLPPRLGDRVADFASHATRLLKDARNVLPRAT